MRHITYRIVFGLVLVAAIIGIALLAYNAGVTHGQALSASAPAVQPGSPAYPAYGVPYWRPFPFFGFGFFGFFAIIFLVFVVFGALRRILWGPRYGWHRWYRGYGNWGDKDSQPGIPPMMAEMHRRMHEAEGSKPADQSTQN